VCDIVVPALLAHCCHFRDFLLTLPRTPSKAALETDAQVRSKPVAN
jgi:hypothetical protein